MESNNPSSFPDQSKSPLTSTQPSKEVFAMEAPRPRTLRIFISYAHEDEKIAIAVSNALQAKLNNVLTEVFLDKTSLETGIAFDTQIADKLATTDILIIIYTGIRKPSHGYTGWEVGFFQGVQRGDHGERDIPRRIVPFYLDNPPATASMQQGMLWRQCDRGRTPISTTVYISLFRCGLLGQRTFPPLSKLCSIARSGRHARLSRVFPAAIRLPLPATWS